MEKDTGVSTAESPIDRSPDASTDIKEPYSDDAVGQTVVLPSGWMYRTRKLGRWTIPHYASPSVQLTMVSFVCFLCPGMFNALSGLGGAGKINPKLGDDMVSLNLPACSVRPQQLQC